VLAPLFGSYAPGLRERERDAAREVAKRALHHDLTGLTAFARRLHVAGRPLRELRAARRGRVVLGEVVLDRHHEPHSWTTTFGSTGSPIRSHHPVQNGTSTSGVGGPPSVASATMSARRYSSSFVAPWTMVMIAHSAELASGKFSKPAFSTVSLKFFSRPTPTR
jgi:hypothetical protein